VGFKKLPRGKRERKEEQIYDGRLQELKISIKNAHKFHQHKDFQTQFWYF